MHKHTPQLRHRPTQLHSPSAQKLLLFTNNLIQTRDEQGLMTLIGKVKSHTGVAYNDEADAGSRGVVDGDILPDITFTTTDPPLGGLRTCPQICSTHTNNPDGKTKLPNLHSGLRKIIKTQNHTTLHPKHTIYSTILRRARADGGDQSIHGYSTAPYRARRGSLEVTWGVNLHRCSKKHGSTLH